MFFKLLINGWYVIFMNIYHLTCIIVSVKHTKPWEIHSESIYQFMVVHEQGCQIRRLKISYINLHIFPKSVQNFQKKKFYTPNSAKFSILLVDFWVVGGKMLNC